MQAAEQVFASNDQQTTLIDQVLACADQDININIILRYIVTIHKNKEENEALIAAINNPDNKEQLRTLITFLYSTWLGRCTGELFKLTLDTCCIPAHFENTNNAINEFISQNKFPQSGKRSLPDNHLKKLNDTIELAQNQKIKPFEDHEKPQDNYIFLALTKIFSKPNIAEALGNIRTDSNRIFNYEALKVSINFKKALDIIKEPLTQFLKDYKAPPQQKASLANAVFLHTSEAKKEGDTDTLIQKETDEYANLTLTQAVQKYIALRKTEKKYHRWGSFFSFTGIPFSLEDKEKAVNKIIYWKERESNSNSDNSKDIENLFTERDIDAIHDHRLGKLSEKYKNEVDALFQFAESKNPNPKKEEEVIISIACPM